MRKQPIDPPQLYEGSPFGMSQAVIDTTSATVYISSQVNRNENNQVSYHTVKSCLLTALANLAAVLNASGSSVESPLSLRICVRDELGEFFKDVVPILAQFLGESRSSLTGIGFVSLFCPEVLVEIKATAAPIRSLES